MNELIEAGTVVEVDTTKSLVKVDLLGVITDWLPLLAQANSFKKQFVSVRTGQQVVVLANRYVVGSIFNVDCKEPDGSNEHIDISLYEDGTRIEYDTQAKTLLVDCVGEVNVKSATTLNIEVADSVNLTATNCNINAESTHHGNITLNGNLLVNGVADIAGVCKVGGLASFAGGAVSASGGMSMSGGDIEADGVGLKAHVHSETGDGGGTTSPPV